MCLHRWTVDGILPAEHSGALIFHPIRETCSECGAERVSHRIESATTPKPRYQAPPVPYLVNAGPPPEPLFMLD